MPRTAKKKRELRKAKKEQPKTTGIVERQNVFFVGLNELDPFDQKQVKDIIYKEFEILARELKTIDSLKVHFKKHEKGPSVKWSVEMVIDAHTHPIVVSHLQEAARWDPVACVHQLIENARREIMHKFKLGTSYDKPYAKGRL